VCGESVHRHPSAHRAAIYGPPALPLLSPTTAHLGPLVCAVCPWHKYRIDVGSGEGLYIGVDIATGAAALKSKGVKQRVHAVRVDASGGVWVRDSTLARPDAAAGGDETSAGSTASSGGGGGSPAGAAASGAGGLPSDTYAKLPFPADSAGSVRGAAGLASLGAAGAAGGPVGGGSGVGGAGGVPLHSRMPHR